jgi:26S proteasome regulatory subunit N7
VEVGGDWDRRNRLKTYEALYLIISRDIRGAAKLLLDCVATFTAVELFSYERFMFYAVVTAIMSLSRTDMKSKIVKNPQVQPFLSPSPRWTKRGYKVKQATLAAPNPVTS